MLLALVTRAESPGNHKRLGTSLHENNAHQELISTGAYYHLLAVATINILMLLVITIKTNHISALGRLWAPVHTNQHTHSKKTKFWRMQFLWISRMLAVCNSKINNYQNWYVIRSEVILLTITRWREVVARLYLFIIKVVCTYFHQNELIIPISNQMK